MKKLRNANQKRILFNLLKKLGPGQKVKLTATSQSMYPLIRENDVIDGEIVAMELIRPHDIVIFFSPSMNDIVVHRAEGLVSSGKSHQLFTRGDNNFFSDQEPIFAKNFLGKVTEIQKQGRRLSLKNHRYRFLRNRTSWTGKLLRKLFELYFHKTTPNGLI